MGEQTVRDLMMINEETGEVTKFEGITNVSLSTEQNDEVKALTGTEFLLNLAEEFGATVNLNFGMPSISVNGKPVNLREFMGLPTNPAKRRKHISQKRFKKLLMANRYQRNDISRSRLVYNPDGDIDSIDSYKELIEKCMEWIYR